MLLKPFTNIIKENKPKEGKSYLGDVEDNEDPKKLGRLKIRIPIYDDLLVEDIPWAHPILSIFLGNSADSVAFSVPEIGSQVRVFYPTGDKNSPYYTGAEINSSNKNTFFDEDYPNSYGMKDSKGNFIKVNKTSGTTIIQHSSTTNVEIVSDGSFTVSLPNSDYSFSCDTLGNFVINNKTLTMNSKAIVMNAEVSIRMVSPIIEADGTFGTSAGDTGVFATSDGSQVTVADGIIQNIGS